MADLSKLFESVISGLLTGGMSAFTTFLAVMHDAKKRIGLIEGRIGTPEPPTGLYLLISETEDLARRVKRQIDDWEDDPPDWAKRLLSRSRATSSSDLSGQLVFEERVDRTLRELRDRLKRLEDDTEERVERVEKKVVDTPDTLVGRDEYLEDSLKRAEEISKIREQLAAVNGLLRGVMSALGYIEADKPRTKLPSFR